MVTPFFSFFPANNPRATRWYYFVNHLIKNDFVVDIVTSCYDKSINGTSNDNLSIYRIKDPINNLINSKKQITIPMSIKVSKSKGKTYLSNTVINIFIRYIRFIYTKIYPDPYFFWSFLACLKIRELLKKNKYDFIISSGYPYSSHIAVNLGLMFIKNKNSLWIGDYGDPWSLIPYISRVSQIRKTMDRFIESRILQKMNYIIVTNEHTKKGYLDQFKFLKASNIIFLPQGFDEEKLNIIQANKNSSKKLRFVYTGTFAKEYRNPIPFFEAIAELKQQLSNVEFYFAGRMSYFVLQVVQDLQITDIIKILSKISYDEALRLQKSADVLLLFGNKSSFAIPGKIYEYFGLKKPIFCIDYPNGLTSDLVKKYNRGIVCENNKNSVIESIKKIINYFNKESINFDEIFNLSIIDSFSWSCISDKLLSFLIVVKKY